MGSLLVVKALLGAGLVDRPRIVVFPQLLGNAGREPIFEGLPDIDLVLIGTDALDGRLVALGYRPRERQPGRLGPKKDVTDLPSRPARVPPRVPDVSARFASSRP
ncbi:MAG: hypothetical protein AVDCRST_MAG55-2571 [uncultured Rubrobacteraceae bacterium]|jgi:hypothetical protein|uniref:Uncharacterized protein n=1 Tax=uncultured Rubrobacteraceae bacterium TaxID=349277 RepID=A0A6J4Q750_9ACTN|nr:MAG: hypothetical protein AVDCRST_MAG55-2571 [uncultured Rubrobacteraceae bacterium]